METDIAKKDLSPEEIKKLFEESDPKHVLIDVKEDPPLDFFKLFNGKNEISVKRFWKIMGKNGVPANCIKAVLSFLPLENSQIVTKTAYSYLWKVFRISLTPSSMRHSIVSTSKIPVRKAHFDAASLAELAQASWFHGIINPLHNLLAEEEKGTFLVRVSTETFYSFKMEVKVGVQVQKFLIQRAMYGQFIIAEKDRIFAHSHSIPKLVDIVMKNMMLTALYCPKVIVSEIDEANSNVEEWGEFTQEMLQLIVRNENILNGVGKYAARFAMMFRATRYEQIEGTPSNSAAKIFRTLADECVHVYPIYKNLLSIKPLKREAETFASLCGHPSLTFNFNRIYTKKEKKTGNASSGGPSSPTETPTRIQMKQEKSILNLDKNSPIENSKKEKRKKVKNWTFEEVNTFISKYATGDFLETIKKQDIDGRALASIRYREDSEKILDLLKIWKLGERLRLSCKLEEICKRELKKSGK